MKASILGKNQAASGRWKGYANTVIQGMSLRRSDVGVFRLARTGPFVPPITFPGPGDVILTEAIRRQVDEQGWHGLAFEPVELARVVELAWHLWDPSEDPPENIRCEPNQLLLEGRPHAPELVQEIGRLWRLNPTFWGTSVAKEVARRPVRYETFLIADAGLKMPDVFQTQEKTAHIFVSERVAEWCNKHLGEWVELQVAKEADDPMG
jgi:hypothetical protein